MTRKPSSFENFIQELDAEVRAAGPKAVAVSEALQSHFRLAAQVISRRRALGLTQKQLAEAAGIHQSEISNIERGASAPTYRTLAKVAHGLQTEVALVPLRKTPGRGVTSRQKVAGVRRAPRVPVMARIVHAKAR